MAPDLNSVPSSPRPIAHSPRVAPQSRRSSQQMAPPPPPLLPLGLNLLPSNQNTVNNASVTTVSAGLSGVTATTGLSGDNTGVGAGPGPLRHPRPLTAADLHLQLEKEQEAVVNRLTRELSMLRAAQNASVVSNSSSTSTGFDTSDHNTHHLLSGPSHPAPSQRMHHRSSSSTSSRSITTGAATNINTPWTTGGGASSLSTGTAVTSSVERARVPTTQSLSRQNSINSTRRSGESSPALLNSAASSYQYPDSFPTTNSQRPSISVHREPSGPRTVSGSGTHEADRHTSISSITSVQTTGRYEEAVYHRHELETVKRENDALKRKIRELERTIRERRQSDASRPRSGSASTLASVSNRDSISLLGRVPDTEGDYEGYEETVGVGESVRSGGVR